MREEVEEQEVEEQEVEERSTEESDYHLEAEAEQNYDELKRAKPKLKIQIQEDLFHIGKNPETGISVKRVERSESDTLQRFSAERFESFSTEERERLKASRVYARKDEYSIYWTIEDTDSGEPYAAVWWIDWNEDNQDTVSIPKTILGMFDGVKEIVSGDS